MLAAEPKLDFITLDFLAEVSLSLLAAERARDPDGGWPRDVLEVLRSLAPYWRSGGRCRFIANAGGLICAAGEYAGGTQGAAFRTIEEKIRVNTDEVLRAARDGGVPPRDAAVDLATRRVRTAMGFQRRFGG